jgi:hypothetical protein
MGRFIVVATAVGALVVPSAATADRPASVLGGGGMSAI